jgi:hypothetical protein
MIFGGCGALVFVIDAQVDIHLLLASSYYWFTNEDIKISQSSWTVLFCEWES